MRAGLSIPGGRIRIRFMATVVKHRKVNIVVLEADEPIHAHCAPGDIAIVAAADGWWTHFIGSDGAIDSYDRPYQSYNEALWAAKAAAEFGFS
jgi:homoserine acetyltransferase